VNAQGTISTTTWINLVMLFMNLTIWLLNATQIVG
jgi:hypothetical protein